MNDTTFATDASDGKMTRATASGEEKSNMTIKKLEIPLHDRSLVQVSRTDAGALYVEVYGPGHAKDGHGYILKGSTLLAETDISALVALLTTTAHQQEAA